MHMSARQPTTPPMMAPMVLGLLMLNVLLLLLLLVLLVLPLLMSMSLLLLMSPLEPLVEAADAVDSEVEDVFGGEVVETAGLVVDADEVVGARVDDVEATVEVVLVVCTGSGVTACFVVKAR